MITAGLDNLLENHLDILHGKKIGIITNPSGVTHDLALNVDALIHSGINVTAVYAPEHGFRAAAKEGEKVDSYTDPKTGIPVYSLYGKTHKPTPEMLFNIDVLIYDLQDGGARFYTFISTLLEAAEACQENKKILMVLDRPNPINGNTVEGNTLDMNFKSFVGTSPITIRYGLTLGELVRFYNDHFKLGMVEQIVENDNLNPKADLLIVPMKNWSRKMWYDQTGLQWVPPSPNFATPDTAIVFPGCCFIEGINVSEGRGTVRPFEWLGAPFIDADDLADKLNNLNLSGIRFRPTFFVPKYSKHTDKMCNGVQVHVLNREDFHPTEIGLHLLKTIHDLYPKDFQWIKFTDYFIDHLLGTDKVRLAIDSGDSLKPIFDSWRKDSAAFSQHRKKYFLYS